MRHSIQTLTNNSGRLTADQVALDLDPSAVFEVTVPNGANKLAIVLYQDDEIVCNWNLHLQNDESKILLTIRYEYGLYRLESNGRKYYWLPLIERFLPSQPTASIAKYSEVEVVFLLDATMNTLIQQKGHDGKTRVGLADQRFFASWFEKTCSQLVEAFAQHALGVSLSLVQFGDVTQGQGSAVDLRPEFLLKPELHEGISFRRFDGETSIPMHALEYSSGGDFIDGVAEAMVSIGNAWSGEKFKLVLLIGDSPGYSLEKPITELRGVSPNIVVRGTCIEEATSALLGQDIVVSTLYVGKHSVDDLIQQHADISDDDLLDMQLEDEQQDLSTVQEERVAKTARLQDSIRQQVASQYQQQIASRADLHFTMDDWDAEKLVDILNVDYLYVANKPTFPATIVVSNSEKNND